MDLTYFAHNGAEHLTSEVTAHDTSGHTMAIIGVSVAALVMLTLVVRLLSLTSAIKKDKPLQKEN